MPVTRPRLPSRTLVFLSVAAAILAPRPATAQDATHLRATVFVTGLTTPVAFVQDPTQPNVQFVVEQGGLIRIVRDGQLLASSFLDLRGATAAAGEQGVLGLAFAPDYATSRRFFVNFTNLSGDTVIARFVRTAADPLRADASSRFDLRWPNGNRFITQPFANHNGGDLHFGSDAYLYIGMGDGGGGNDPFNSAQNPMSLLGKMLRIDVAVPDSDPEGYNVPPDNPFVGNDAFLPEIWALGLRNPFRFTVDAIAHGGSGALVIGDVGQAAWEEVDFDPFGRGGRNYGWRNREGAHDNVTSEDPATLPLIDPIVEYSHTEGNVITGGVVYRGSGLGAEFSGRYFFSDFGAGRVWSVGLSADPTTGEAVATGMTEYLLGMPVGNVSAFGMDAACEVYLVDYSGGRLLRIDPVAARAGSGCATPIVPCPNSITPTGISVSGGAVSGTLSVTTPRPECTWSAIGNSPFITFENGTGRTGSGVVSYTVAANFSTNARTGTAIVAGETFTVNQGGAPVDGTRQAREHARADFNGDGSNDLLWQDTTGGYLATWMLSGSHASWTAVSIPQRVIDTNWRIVGTGDFNGDGKPDIVWHHRTRGDLYLWYMDGVNHVGSSAFSFAGEPDLRWQVVGVGDFNGDHKPDLMWQHDTGWLTVFLMNGATLIRSVDMSPGRVLDPNWHIVGTADLNADGQSDLIFEHSGTGELAAWILNGTVRARYVPFFPRAILDRGWRLAAVLDLDGDQTPDLIWQHATQGAVAVWYMNGTLRAAVQSFPWTVGSNWTIVGPK